MKARTIVLAVLVCLVCGTFAFAANPCAGTWKLNESKSMIAAGAPKNTSVVCAAAGDAMKITVEGVDGQGKPAHNAWTGKFDGKDYPLTGDATADTRAYKQVDDHTQEFANKKDGKVTNKAETLADAKATHWTSVAYENLEVVAYGDAAIATGVYIGKGTDAAAFDPGTGLAFSSNGDGTVTVVKGDEAGRYTVAATVATQKRARTIALDSTTHRLYLQLISFCG